MLHNRTILKTFIDLYDGVKEDKDEFIDEEEFNRKIEALVDTEFITTAMVNDNTIYSAKIGLKYPDIVHIDDCIKQSIMLLLIENPTTFFILQNTQKGKMKIVAEEIKLWGQDNTKKVVAFMIVDNDKSLSDQSADGMLKIFAEQNIRLYTLSSNSKTKYEDIKIYIDAYAAAKPDDPEYPMPVILLLCNGKQCEKKLKLQKHILKKVTEDNSPLRYGEIWDEADKTYEQMRDKPFNINGDKPFNINGDILSCRKFTVDNTIALYRLGFVTASEGNLLEESYPECANAYLYPDTVSPEDQLNYRALHHHEAITHHIPFMSKHNNNSYATQIIENNKEHFMAPIHLSSGEIYYRKIIINSNASIKDMMVFANLTNSKGFYTFVFNGQGIHLYRQGYQLKNIKIKGKRLNESLFYIYKKLNLNDKPIIILGRRKVDRGLGFHYCPRDNIEVGIEGTLGTLRTKNKDGLVWTDMILGKIDHKETAIQKAGRLAGIIGNSPQYPGQIHYWTDEATENMIRRHNTIVDKSNSKFGCSVLQAVKHAEDATPKIKVNHRVQLNTFLVYKDECVVRNVCNILGYKYRVTNPKTNGPNVGFRETSLNTARDKVSLLDAIKSVPSAYGTNNGITTYRTCYPCYKDLEDKNSLHFVIIIRPTTVNIDNKLNEISLRYPGIIIPQVGQF